MWASGRILFLLHAFLFFSLILVPVQISHGQTATAAVPISQAPAQNTSQSGLPAKWNDAVKTLAGKIAAAVKPSGAISLSVRNISSLSAADVDAIREAFAMELEADGLKLASGNAEVQITLSENIEGYLWIGEIQTANAARVELVQVAKLSESSPSAKPAAEIQRRIVWSQKDEILDFADHTFSPGLLDINYVTIFEPGYLRTFEFSREEWIEKKKASIPDARVTRDLRGLLVDAGDSQTKVYVGRQACFGLFLSQHCAESSHQDWPFVWGYFARFVGSRNYFSGFVEDRSSKTKYAAFYSTAIGLDIFDHITPLIATELDGKSRLYQSGQYPIAAFTDWGDDIASITKPACGAGWQVLVTGTGDWTEPDHIQIYLVSFGNNSATAKAEGQPLQFAGPILSMWQADDKKSVRVVSKNLQTGMYEASIITITCSQ